MQIAYAGYFILQDHSCSSAAFASSLGSSSFGSSFFLERRTLVRMPRIRAAATSVTVTLPNTIVMPPTPAMS